MDIPYSRKEIRDAILETVSLNKIKWCYIRSLVYVGYGVMGLYPEGIVTLIKIWNSHKKMF